MRVFLNINIMSKCNQGDILYYTRHNKHKSNARMNRRTHRIHQPGRTNCTQRYQGK